MEKTFQRCFMIVAVGADDASAMKPTAARSALAGLAPAGGTPLPSTSVIVDGTGVELQRRIEKRCCFHVRLCADPCGARCFRMSRHGRRQDIAQFAKSAENRTNSRTASSRLAPKALNFSATILEGDHFLDLFS